MKVLFFGSLVEKAGTTELSISSIHSLTALKEHVFKTYPALTDKVFAIAVNEAIVAEDMLLKENDEVAFMPPFSGG
jgi:molybdopterin synthase sulfur carrier subunit